MSEQVAVTAAPPGWQVRSVYQPIVDLTTRAVVGVEALARGPVGSAVESAPALFAEAERRGDVAGLDWACRVSAVDGAIGALPSGVALFINVEPAAVDAPVPGVGRALARQVEASGARLVLEITERGIGDRPAALLAFCERVRSRGWSIAVDDVGANAGSLAWLPLLDPEIVKLDMRLIQRQPDVEVARIINAVLAHTGRRGATVVAEGVETEEHLELAESMGAHLGQGWLFGRPVERLGPLQVAPELGLGQEGGRRTAPLRTTTRAAQGRASAVALAAPVARTPWDLVRDDPRVRRSRKRLLTAMSHHLEAQAMAEDPATVVVGAIQHGRHFTPRMREQYTRLAESSFFVGVLGADLDPVLAPGVHGRSLSPDDPLVEEWTILVVSPHVAAALIAHDVGDDAPEADRRFDYLLTHDRETVLAAARMVVGRFDEVPD